MAETPHPGAPGPSGASAPDAHGEPAEQRRGETLTAWDGSWQAHRERQRRTWLAATPAQRLAWLEEAIALAHRAGALPGSRDAS